MENYHVQCPICSKNIHFLHTSYHLIYDHDIEIESPIKISCSICCEKIPFKNILSHMEKHKLFKCLICNIELKSTQCINHIC
jgi:hypothetical protein